MADDSKNIADLVADAKLLSDYGMQAGLLSDTGLDDAIAAVEAASPTNRSSPQVIKLREEMTKASRLVPFATLRELRKGWRPGLDEDARTLTAVLVLLSLVLMILAVKLTAIYNTGVELVGEIQTVASTDPERRFGQLSRQLIAARQKLTQKDVAPADLGDESLKVQSYFETFDLLRDLDQELHSIDQRVTSFEELASYPVLFSYPAWSGIYNLEQWAGYLTPEGQKHFLKALQQQSGYSSRRPENDFLARVAAATGRLFGLGNSGRDATANGCQQYVDFASHIDQQINYIDNNFPGSHNFGSIIREYLNSSLYMTCFERINYTPYFVPRIEDYDMRVKRAIQPYASYILPAIFGAVGAILFHIRLILDPLQRNMRTFRIFHRIVGGAVAGIMLAWLISSDSKVLDQFTEVGFGVFALCFLVGFSLDIFFEILQRLVNLIRAAVGQIGVK